MSKGYSRLIKEDKIEEDATQVANIDAGKVSVFGSDAGNKFKEDDWYKQLFELNDMEETTIQDQYKVEYSVVENTGGGTLVEYGKLANGLYYGLNEETLVIYNDDYHQAYLNQDEEDFYLHAGHACISQHLCSGCGGQMETRRRQCHCRNL